MKEKILKQFDKEFPADHEILGDKPFETSKEIKDFISQALDEYADWKIKECLPDKIVRKEGDYCGHSGEWLEQYDDGFNDCLDQILSNKDKK